MASRSRGVRVPQLFLGLFLAAFGIVLTFRSELGVSPWDVLHGGLAERTGLSLGVVVQGVGAVVLVASLLLGVRPGFGTICNLVLIGFFENLLLGWGVGDGIGEGPLALRLLVLVVGIVLIGVAAALYIGAHYGAGPRDGLMVALHTRGGWSIGLARTVIEASALVVGIALGGPVGIGTALYTVSIGPATQVAFRLLRQTPVRKTTTEPI
jgi:uncharacterized membrane protein YczE